MDLNGRWSTGWSGSLHKGIRNARNAGGDGLRRDRFRKRGSAWAAADDIHYACALSADEESAETDSPGKGMAEFSLDVPPEIELAHHL